LLTVVPVILADVHPDASASQCTAFTIGQRECEPILVRLQGAKKAVGNVFEFDDVVERDGPLAFGRWAQARWLIQNFFDFGIVGVFSTFDGGFFAFLKDVAVSARSDAATSSQDIPSIARYDLPCLFIG